MPYPRTVEELKENAVIYWPSEIAEKERNSSIIPLLLATQDHFISVLHLADVAYVVDGAGNFERRSFVQDLIDYSDCIVNFSEIDIQYLAKTMEGNVSNGT